MRRALLGACLLLAACASGTRVRDTGLDGLRVDAIDPGLIVPGSKIVIRGESFVDSDLGQSRLAFDGFLAQAPLRFSLPARFVSTTRMELIADAAFLDAIGGQIDGQLEGRFTIDVRSTVDSELHRSPPFQVALELRSQSTPSFANVIDGLTFVNQPIDVVGTGFLLGGKEGSLAAHLVGCFTPLGQTACGPPVDVMLPATPASEFDRNHAVFPYATSISGIAPGVFLGEVSLVNEHQGGLKLSSSSRPVRLEVQRPRITGASATAASLGQYVFIEGGGFVGGNADESTVISLTGTFVDTAGMATPLDLVLVPAFVSGPRLRYVLDETDQLGGVIDLRTRSGMIQAVATPTVQKGAAKLTGDSLDVMLRILPVKQVVHVQFLNSYESSLRLFGLRAADALIRERVLALSGDVFRSLNVEFRGTVPADFALYSTVDIAGPDPNGAGYYGYDNTPGKDVENLRLYDRIGGVNATTQSDGYAGYGGVFTEAFFGFSEHPNGLAPRTDGEPLFDAIFDPFRPDAGGNELTQGELAQLRPPVLEDGVPCPAPSGDRRLQISCAVWTLGNLIASTMVHEVGHSLGLADPYGPPKSYHNQGDLPNRLMETGDGRPFVERAVLGQGPAHFCIDEYEYLRNILGDGGPATTLGRQPCD